VHLTALVVVPGFLVLGWWQVTRALGGNALSWVYSVEWPFFAGYAVYMWWKLIHEEPGGRSWGRRAAPSGLEPATAGDTSPSTATAPAPSLGPAPTPPAEPATVGAAPAGEPAAAAAGEPGAGDAELDDYNRYLEALNASGRRKRW
jgi:hypothetical protein